MGGRDAQRSAGFTLVEMLASLAVLSALSLLILTGLGWAGRLHARTRADAGRVEAVASVQDLLRDRIAHLTPTLRLGALSAQTDFDGEGDTLTFMAPPLRNVGPGEVQRYRLWLSGDGRLALSRTSDLARAPERPTETLVLLGGVHALDLAYFGVAGGDPQPQWWTRWRQQPAPPLLVRVRIAFADQDPRAWPDLLVHPEATVDTACVVDPGSGVCKGRS